MNDFISKLTDKDDKKAYEQTKQIAAASELSKEYYHFLNDFASLLDNDKSYVRTRAFILCCSQARWDTEGRFNEILPDMLKLFHDTKPTVVRQCLNAVKEIIVFRPELSERIKAELTEIDLSQYRDSMIPLIEKDISEVMELPNER